MRERVGTALPLHWQHRRLLLLLLLVRMGKAHLCSLAACGPDQVAADGCTCGATPSVGLAGCGVGRVSTGGRVAVLGQGKVTKRRQSRFVHVAGINGVRAWVQL